MSNQFVAYQDERHGLGAWVAEQIAADMFRFGYWTDADGEIQRDEDGRPLTAHDRPTADLVSTDYGMRLSTATGRSYANVLASPAPRTEDSREGLTYAYRTWTSPRASAEATVSAVISSKAEIGVLPFYDNDNSFNKETLAALIDFPGQRALREYVAESNYVLAAPTDLIHEIEQAGYTNSFAPAGGGEHFQWNRDKQQRYLRKLTTVYATPDAAKHCGPALDGYRARGIDVQILPDGQDIYREGLHLASTLLDPERVVETRYSNTAHERVSKSRGANHVKPLIGVLLSADKAMASGGYQYDSDYAILETDLAGADRIRTSFVAIKKGSPGGSKGSDPVAAEFASVRGYFVPTKKSGRGSADHRALYPLSGEKRFAEKTKGFEAPAYARFVYKFDTVGADARDPSPVFKALAEQKLSYQTTSLDNRPGHPMIVSIDVPAASYTKMKPVLSKLMSMHGVRRLADFPAVQPMVKLETRPKTNGMVTRTKIAMGAIVAILAGLGVYALGAIS